MTATNAAAAVAPNVTIFIVPETLTDGSVVYNVLKVGSLLLRAVTKEDAEQLAYRIEGAINDHSNEIAGVVDECR